MIKNIRKYFIGCLFGCALTFTVTTFAESTSKTIEVLFNNINIAINGKSVKLDNILYNGTTYVPIRTAAELFGKEVVWDGKTNIANINDKGNNHKIEIPNSSKSLPPSISTYKEIAYKDMFVIRNSFDIYFDISNINKFSNLQIEYNATTKELSFTKDNKPVTIKKPGFMIVTEYKDKVYISKSMLGEMGINIEKLSVFKDIIQLNKAYLPEGAQITESIINGKKVETVKYKENLYISQVTLASGFRIFPFEVYDNYIEFNENNKRIIIDTSNDTSYLVIGLTQYFDTSMFNGKLQVEKDVKN